MFSATVLIPTHNHAETLRHAVASVQAQTLQDFEIFIVGDGASDETRECVVALMKEENRIRFFDFPKGPRKGEIHRHAALTEATGRFVAYLGDDDLWLPGHLTTVEDLLSEADFGNTLHIGLDAQGAPFALAADLNDPAFRRRMLTEFYNRFDFTFGCHTLEAYRRLPYGWRTTPSDFPWTDLYMWRQFLAEPWCRARSAFVPTAICTQTHLRPHLNNRQRSEELAYWRAESSRPDFREMLWGKIAENMARNLIRHEIKIEDVAKKADARANEAEARAGEAEAQIASLLNSKSWRITRPLRVVSSAFKTFR